MQWYNVIKIKVKGESPEEMEDIKMAKYDVTYACGHTETVDLYGKTSERERKIEWMENNCVCPSCYKAEQAAKALECAEAYDLPELTGSPKQITWAETLRGKVFQELEELEQKAGKKADATEEVEFLDWLKGQTEARFWIDNRNTSILFLAKKWKSKKEEAKLEGTPKQVAWAEKLREELTRAVEENMGQDWFGLNALDLETSAATIISYHTDYRGRFDELLRVLADRAKGM